jgi:hypothetical protein
MKKSLKNDYFVFKFGDSIGHAFLTKYRIALNFTLLDSSLEGASFDL